MVRYILKQIKITGNKCFGKWFAKNVVEETIDLDALAEHMSHHNSPYSKGVIKAKKKGTSYIHDWLYQRAPGGG